MTLQGWFPLGLTGLISLQSKGLLRVISNSTIRKHQFFGTQPSLWSSSHIHTWLLEKAIALTRPTFVGRVMSLLFNMLSRFVIGFLPVNIQGWFPLGLAGLQSKGLSRSPLVGNGERSVLILLEGLHSEVVPFRWVSTPGTDNSFSRVVSQHWIEAFDWSLA